MVFGSSISSNYMAAASPTPLPAGYGSRLMRQPSRNHQQQQGLNLPTRPHHHQHHHLSRGSSSSRTGSPLSSLAHSNGFAAGQSGIDQLNIGAGDSSEDDEPAPAPQLSRYAEALLAAEQQNINSGIGAGGSAAGLGLGGRPGSSSGPETDAARWSPSHQPAQHASRKLRVYRTASAAAVSTTGAGNAAREGSARAESQEPQYHSSQPNPHQYQHHHHSGSNTPVHGGQEMITPFPHRSVRVRPTGLMKGPPIRGKQRRTPQSDPDKGGGIDGGSAGMNQGAGDGGNVGSGRRDDAGASVLGGHDAEAKEQPAHNAQAPAQGTDVAALDQENAPASIMKAQPHPLSGTTLKEDQQPDSMMKPMKIDEPAQQKRAVVRIRDDHQHQQHKPLAELAVNTPRRAPPPAPAPPPKMSMLEAATSAAGASAAKTKRRRHHMAVNGKNYSLMGRIGKGGSSEVYRVMAENGRAFALKRVKLDGADEAAVRGYKGEIDLLNDLKDVDRVVRLYDFEVDEEKNSLGVLMELGESDLAKLLRTKLESERPMLDLSFTRYYWKEMLECVASVHEHDIVHSDLKPANFLMVQGCLKLIDFGIASAIDTDITLNVHRDSHVGTPNYMSPESLEDTNRHVAAASNGGALPQQLPKMMKLGKPSDVWSLGCILYQMTYGRPPFAHIPNQISRVMAIMNRNHVITFPERGVGDVRVPGCLRRTLRRCLQRDPQARPTVHQLLSAGDEFLYPDQFEAGEDGDEVLRINKEVLGQMFSRIVERCRDEKRPPPSEHEIHVQYPASFYAKIKELMEKG
ncbi:kinase-like domain-containing protein [Lineolata rhizophorae]|uniref:Kinase-like domain-containing protein n=1 Tax=Lineolata rhizophorae TaxID=578093 RepID=A0A6A6P797_9PEZI|nr:kinase-like domain-containing protein [Lineolata rhizophorae]